MSLKDMQGKTKNRHGVEHRTFSIRRQDVFLIRTKKTEKNFGNSEIKSAKSA